MKAIRIADCTLRDNPTISFKDKIEIARKLDKIHVDVIELSSPKEKQDELALHSIVTTIKNSIVCCVAGTTESEIQATWDILKDAQKPRLKISMPVSAVQMEYLAHKKPAKMLECIDKLVRFASTLCDDVEYAAEDATRAEPEFLKEAILTAVEAGAKTVTLCDTAGVCLPYEFSALVDETIQYMPKEKEVSVAVECSRALHVSVGAVVNCLHVGAMETKTIVYDGNLPLLSAIVDVMHARGDFLDCETKVDVTNLKSVLREIQKMTALHETNDTGFVRESTEHKDDGSNFADGTSLEQIQKAIKKLGYDLSVDDAMNVYEEFSRLVKRKTVGNRDLEAIIANVANQVPPTYKLVSFVCNNGNIINSTASIVLEKEGETLQGVCVGDGPIDAAFRAVEQIIGHHYELDDFQIQAVTEGRDSMGETIVKLRADGKLYAGRGLSTDIIGASIRAYLNALNKIVYEERT